MLLILEESERKSWETTGPAIPFDWQELRDQVRKMIMNDVEYKAIKAE